MKLLEIFEITISYGNNLIARECITALAAQIRQEKSAISVTVYENSEQSALSLHVCASTANEGGYLSQLSDRFLQVMKEHGIVYHSRWIEKNPCR